MRNALQKYAHGGFSTIGERDPRPERTTTTAGTPQRRSTDRREPNAKTVARTKGHKASHVRYRERGRQRSPFVKLTIRDMVTVKTLPHGKRKKRGAHAEKTGARRRTQGAQAHPPEPGQITLRLRSVRRTARSRRTLRGRSTKCPDFAFFGGCMQAACVFAFLPPVRLV